MAFKYRIGKKVICKEEFSDEQCPVLILAQITKKTFADTHYTYLVAHDCGDVHEVSEKDLSPVEPKVETEETEVDNTETSE